MRTPTRCRRRVGLGFVGCTVAVGLFFGSVAIAQEPAETEPEVAGPAESTAIDTSISKEALALTIRPLLKEEVETEAKNWLKVVQDAARAVTQEEVRALGLEGDARTAANTEAQRLAGLRDQAIERLKVVLADFKKKGGSVDDAEAYIASVGGLNLEGKGAGDMVQVAKDWVLSEDRGLTWLKNAVVFIAIILAFKILAGLLARATRKITGRMEKLTEVLRELFVSAVRNITMIVGLIMAFAQIGIDVTPFVAGIGAMGLILGFALQETLNNFAAGIMIAAYRPFDIGHVVSAAGVTGKVSAMNLVSTTLLTPDNQTIVVPNGSIWGNVITNVTGNETRRVDLVFGCGYDDDINEVHSILEQIVNRHELVLKDPEPVIRVHELADSSVNFICRPWTKTSDYWAVYWDLTAQVKAEFDQKGISIPYPQQDVHMHQVVAS